MRPGLEGEVLAGAQLPEKNLGRRVGVQKLQCGLVIDARPLHERGHRITPAKFFFVDKGLRDAFQGFRQRQGQLFGYFLARQSLIR